MLKISSTILKKIFWIIKGEIILVCLPAKLLHVLDLSLALTSLFVYSSTFVFIFRKELPNVSYCKFFWFYFITVITIIVKFLNFGIHSPLHFKNNSMRIFKRSNLITIIIIYFSGSVDTIVFFKTGNPLPQCFWYSSLFFTVDGCVDCVKGILDSLVSVSWYVLILF